MGRPLRSAAENPGREREQGLDEPEEGFYSDSDQPQGEHQEPD